jgi:hypothetical protein
MSCVPVADNSLPRNSTWATSMRGARSLTHAIVIGTADSLAPDRASPGEPPGSVLSR